MKLYSYVVTHDTGFAPNPFWGYCTLATCKPTIRKKAEIGDWVVGLSPKEHGHRLIYAMEVTETLSFDTYFNDRRFAKKRPDCNGKTGTKSRRAMRRCGDNIYKPQGNGAYQQLQSGHSGPEPFGREENPRTKKKDLGDHPDKRGVLISRKGHFYYFGAEALKLPDGLLARLQVRRAHRVLDTESPRDKIDIKKFISFLQRKAPSGYCGNPTKWPDEKERSGSHCA